ncbi:MAG TPA: auxin-binding protein [Gammaproteobacteria bacterium]|nr:auxin-binding protein [Gammaproteobacteria bacterium]
MNATEASRGIAPLIKRFLCITILCVMVMSALAESDAFQVTYSSAINPIAINKMHEWILDIKTSDGTPVTDAEVVINGGMPAHNHGLPTSPKVTQNLGQGKYRVEGVRFHMSGYWEMRVTVKANGIEDTVVISLEL